MALAAWKRPSPAEPSARSAAKTSRAARRASASSALRSVNHKPAIGQRGPAPAKCPRARAAAWGADARVPTAGGANCRRVAALAVFPDEHASVDRGLEQGKVQVQQEENRERDEVEADAKNDTNEDDAEAEPAAKKRRGRAAKTK